MHLDFYGNATTVIALELGSSSQVLNAVHGVTDGLPGEGLKL
jgi:hypothetical protein